MKKKLFVMVALAVLAAVFLTGCPGPYTGKYYDVTWGRTAAADVNEFNSIFNVSLTDAQKVEQLKRISESVAARKDMAETSLKNYLKDIVNLQDAWIKDIMDRLEVHPEYLGAYHYVNTPDVHYWYYIKVVD